MMPPLADVPSNYIGVDTRIWQFCVVLSGAVIGEGCNIFAGVVIENDVVIGNNVPIKSFVQVWDGIQIEDNVFIGPNATFTNDKFLRSKNPDRKLKRTTVCRDASIGANDIILPGITIGEYAFIDAGSVVTKSIPAGETWIGNPAHPMDNFSPVSF